MSSLLSIMQAVPAIVLGDGSFWLPPPDSSTAPAVDRVFYLVLGICAVFFVAVVATMVYFSVIYRRRPGHESQKTATSQQCVGSSPGQSFRC